MGILDKLHVIESDAVPKEGAIIEKLSTSIKITHSCGCVLVQHLFCGKPNMNREENPSRYDHLQAEMAYYVELCPAHKGLK